MDILSLAQTITTEWTAEKHLGKRVHSKQAPKHKLGNWTNMVESKGRRSPSKQQKAL